MLVVLKNLKKQTLLFSTLSEDYYKLLVLLAFEMITLLFFSARNNFLNVAGHCDQKKWNSVGQSYFLAVKIDII